MPKPSAEILKLALRPFRPFPLVDVRLLVGGIPSDWDCPSAPSSGP